MGRAAVDAVLSDYHSAPISDGLKVTLELLEIMTLQPRKMTEERVNAVIDSGISMETLIDAIEVGVVLKLISRYAGASISPPRPPPASPGSRAAARVRVADAISRRSENPGTHGEYGRSTEWSCREAANGYLIPYRPQLASAASTNCWGLATVSSLCFDDTGAHV